MLLGVLGHEIEAGGVGPVLLPQDGHVPKKLACSHLHGSTMKFRVLEFHMNLAGHENHEPICGVAVIDDDVARGEGDVFKLQENFIDKGLLQKRKKGEKKEENAFNCKWT